MAKLKSLNTKQQATIEQRLESNADAPYQNAAATVWELIARKTRAAEEDSKEAMARPHRRFRDLNEQQLLLVNATGERSHDGLFPPKCIGDGILRRFTMDSPVELALRLSIGARFHWAETQWSGNNYHDELFRPILQAVAARDFTAAEKLAAISPPVIENPNTRSYAAIFTGVCGLMKHDCQLLNTALSLFPKTDPAYIKAIKSVLQAVADESAEDFAAGMNKMLSAYRRYMFNDELYGLIDPHALDNYELCRQFSTSLVDDFDVERKLPWDREYFRWSQEVNDISDQFDGDVPEVIRPYLLDFEPISWGKEVLANWHSE